VNSPHHAIAPVLVTLALALAALPSKADESKPIAIADVKREAPVDFQKEILPLLNKNCVACHNTKKAENSLVLETPQSILKGGDSGPAVVPKNGAESLLLAVASHKDEPIMPPADNNVGAVAFTSEQLGLLKLWIDQGATGQASQSSTPIQWQSLAATVNPIYAVAITADGQYAACGRANQIFVYQVASGQLVARLTDPSLAASGLYQNQGAAHLDLVQSLAFSPDGNLLASGGYREVKLWRRPHDVRKLELAASTAAAHSIAISPEGKLAAIGDASGAIKLCDAATGKEVRTLTGHAGPVAAIQFLPGGTKLLSGSLDKTLRAWNVADGATAGQIETPAPINALAVLADGAQVATGGADNVISLWTIPADAAGAFTAGAKLSGHTGPITGLALLPSDKTQLISASADGDVRQWNLTNNQLIREMKHGAAVTALAVRADGKQIASAGADNAIKLWNAADGQPWASPDKQPIVAMKGDFRAQFRVAHMERALAAATAKVADDKKAVADAEAKIIATAAAVTASQTAKDAAAKTLAEKTAAVKAPTDAKAAVDKELAAAQEANKVAVEKAAQAKAALEKDAKNADLIKANDEAGKAAAEADKKVKESEKKVQDAIAALTKATTEAATADAANMASLQAATSAVSAIKKAVTDVPLAETALKAAEAALAKTQSDTDAAKQVAAAAEKPIRSLAYSADSTLLASGGDNQLVRTWNAETGAPLETFAAHTAPVQAVAFAADGTLLSAAAQGAAIEWSTSPEWTLERTIGNFDNPTVLVDRVLALTFSPDGNLLATGGGEPSRSGELKIWNVADGTPARSIVDAHSDTIFSLEFSPDGLFLASSGADRFVKIWNVAAGTHNRSFEGHTHHVLGVSWKSDGKVLASCGADNVIKIWDFVTGDQRRTTQPLGKEVTSIEFVGTTQKVLVTSGDKTVRLVNTDNGAMERTYAGPNDFMYSSAASADGRLTAAGGQESVLFVWLVDNGQLIRSFSAPKPPDAKPDDKKPVAQTAGG
jgi:WD40 repeat protein